MGLVSHKLLCNFVVMTAGVGISSSDQERAFE